MDKNTVIGFVLLAILFIGYFYYTKQGQLTAEQEKQAQIDSINRLRPQIDSSKIQTEASPEINQISSSDSNLFQDTAAKEEYITLENEVLKITFTNKGGQPKTVQLKKFKRFNNNALILEDGQFNTITYPVNIGENKTAQTGDLFFTPQPLQKLKDGSTVLNYTLNGKSNEKLQHQFIIPAKDYMLNFNIGLNGSNTLLTQNTINLIWKAKANQQERDIEWETQQSHVAFVENGEYDFETLAPGKNDLKLFDKPVEWVALKQQFFATAIIAGSKFSNGEIRWEAPSDTSKQVVAEATANLRLNIPPGQSSNVNMKLFYGPGDYNILKSYNNQMHDMVPLGSGIFAFVKYINRGFVMPVFNFLTSKIASYGLAIALLTIIIRLLISPLTYQSYLSGAKMKVLKPEIDLLREKHGDDKQTFGMEQMKLFRSAGVNPLGGCIPALLQIPIFFALYNFFNSDIDLRGQSFLWATDLSTYDSIYNIPFSIPFYGSHISLFTILAVITSLLISLYGMSNMQDNSNPVMKYMPFIFPVILLGVFNKLPSSLTWYYTVSNVITLLIQFVIQKYIIDHDKILTRLEANKKKPRVVSKWQQRVNAMQESNKKLQSMQTKSKANRK